ncbi:unnamed protein product [Ectocarpus fasciculatus]
MAPCVFRLFRPITDLYEEPIRALETTKIYAWEFKPQTHQDGPAMTLNVGSYTIKCSYEEKRYEQPRLTKEVEMTMRAVPGEPCMLKPKQHQHRESHAASNAHDVDASKAHRRLLEDFEIAVVDCKDNVVGESFNGPVLMQIKQKEALDGVRVAESDVPQLENAPGGILKAERIGAGIFMFKDVSLQAGVGSKEGTYRLVVHSERRHELSIWSIDFLFTSHEKLLGDIRVAEEELARVQGRYEAYKTRLSGPETAKNKARRRVAAMIEKLPPDLVAKIGYADTDYKDCGRHARETREHLKTMNRNQEDRYKEREKRYPSFKRETRIIIHSTINKITRQYGAGEHDIRCIAEIGLVNSKHHAQILSHTAGAMMKGVLVLNNDQLTTLREEKGCGISKETVQALRQHFSEMARAPPPPGCEGCIGYVVNMFEARPGYQGLRDTLFWAIYGDMVLFDTYANAIAYQNGLQHAHERRDILVEQDGTVLRRNGYMHPPPGKEDLENLSMMFRVIPVHHNREYKRRKHEITQLADIIANLKELARANAEVADNRDNVLENEYKAAWTHLQNLTGPRKKHKDKA